MSSIKLNSAHIGFAHLSDVAYEIDRYAGDKARLEHGDVTRFLDAVCMRPTALPALEAIFTHTQRRHQAQTVSLTELRATIAAARLALDEADQDGDGVLSTSEQATIASQWGALVAFAREHEGLNFGRVLDAERSY